MLYIYCTLNMYKSRCVPCCTSTVLWTCISHVVFRCVQLSFATETAYENVHFATYYAYCEHDIAACNIDTELCSSFYSVCIRAFPPDISGQLQTGTPDTSKVCMVCSWCIIICPAVLITLETFLVFSSASAYTRPASRLAAGLYRTRCCRWHCWYRYVNFWEKYQQVLHQWHSLILKLYKVLTAWA